MVYLAELLVVMIYRLKIVRIRAQNVPRERTQALRRQSVSHISLDPGKRRCRVLMCRGAILFKHLKNRLRTTCACLAVASEQESCRNSKGKKVKEVDLYCAFIVHCSTSHSRRSHNVTCKLHRTCLYLVSIQQMAHPQTEVADI